MSNASRSRPSEYTIAMTRIAPMSSTIASARRNSFNDGVTRVPRSPRTPSAIAMSVAVGIPQPPSASVPAVMAR